MDIRIADRTFGEASITMECISLRNQSIKILSMDKQCTSFVVMTISYTMDEIQPNATQDEGELITDVCAGQLVTNTGPPIYSDIASKGE
jgi:hypothetical protein